MDKEALFKEASSEWDAGNLTHAFDLFLRLAERGDPVSQNNVGFFYDNGIGVQANKEKARYWYEKAAENGDICAYSNIAILYQEAGDLESAIDWFGKALIKGDGDAALKLAKIYLDTEGYGDAEKAVKYLKLTLASDSVTPASLEEAEALLRTVAGSK